MAEFFEFRPQFLKVVHLAVVGDGVVAVGREHRLGGGGGQVEDRQAAVTKPDVAVEEKSLAVGPPVRNGIRHAPSASAVTG